MKSLRRRHAHIVGNQFRIACKIYFKAGGQKRLGPRHSVNLYRLERGGGAENLIVQSKPHGRAMLFGRGALFNRPDCLSARKFLRPEKTVPRSHDNRFGRQCVDDGRADAVQPAGRLVHMVVEFPAGMQHGKYDLERRFSGIFRMLVNRHAAPVV